MTDQKCALNLLTPGGYMAESAEELEFLKTYDPSKFPIITVTVDVISLYRHGNKDWKVLLIERGNWPYKGSWALPGGFMDEYETAEQAAVRELAEETGVLEDVNTLWPLEAVTTPHRDPRGRVITLPFVTFLNDGRAEPWIKAGDDAKSAKWFRLKDALELDLAFDHRSTLIKAVALADLESGIQRSASTMKRV